VCPAPVTGVNAAAVESLRRFGRPGAKKRESSEELGYLYIVIYVYKYSVYIYIYIYVYTTSVAGPCYGGQHDCGGDTTKVWRTGSQKKGARFNTIQIYR